MLVDYDVALYNSKQVIGKLIKFIFTRLKYPWARLQRRWLEYIVNDIYCKQYLRPCWFYWWVGLFNREICSKWVMTQAYGCLQQGSYVEECSYCMFIDALVNTTLTLRGRSWCKCRSQASLGLLFILSLHTVLAVCWHHDWSGRNVGFYRPTTLPLVNRFAHVYICIASFRDKNQDS